MRWLRSFALFWYDFVVGDDWTLAIGVVAALAVAALLSGRGLAGWVWLPVAVWLVLALSLWRAARRPGDRA